MKKHNVSVIIINFNSSHYTIDCIESIKQYVNPSFLYNIVVVDNNSEHADREKLINYCDSKSNVELILSKINLGFSGGNMLGVQNTNAEYVFFLNNDTLLLNDCLTILYEFMESHKNVGICTAQMYNTDKTFHHSFSYFPTLSFKIVGSSVLRLCNPSKYPQRKKVYTEPLKVDFVTGAAMFIDFKKFAEVGGFDTNYFLYCEEEDIAMKLKCSGYSAYVVPQAQFIHHMGKSTVRNYAIEKENYISLLYYQRKNASYILYTIHKLLYFFKNAKKIYKHIDYLKLAFFILMGANLKYSLKHKQTIRNEDN